MPLNVSGYEIQSRDARMYSQTSIVRAGLVLHLDASIYNNVSYGTTWFDLSGIKSTGTINNPFASPEEAKSLNTPAGNYYFKFGSMSSPQLLEFQPNYYENKAFCCVFRSPYRSTATTNKIDLNIPMGGLLVQRDDLAFRAAVYWSTSIQYNTVGGTGNNTADSGYSPRRVILGNSGGHGIYATNQSQCNWPTATGAIGAGWDGSTCGSFPNDLIWGTGESNTATYSNRSGTWSHWVTWNGFKNKNGTMVNGPTFNSGNGGSIVFDGVDDIIKIPNNVSLDTQTPTVEVWIKTNDVSQNGFWFEKGTVNTQYSLFQEGSVIQWRQRLTDGTLTSLSTTTANFINTTNWYQVVGTFVSGNRRLYINGTLVNSDTQSGTISTNTGGMSIGVFGGFSGARGYYYNGNIAQVRIYNRVLSQAEITHNYNVTKGRFGL